MEKAYNSTNPYNFTFVLNSSDKRNSDEFLTDPYDPYEFRVYLFFRLVFAYLKNVRFRFATNLELFLRLSNVTGKMEKKRNAHHLAYEAIEHGVLDAMAAFFRIAPYEPLTVHVSPISHRNSFVMLSSVSLDTRKEGSETLSFQGLSSSVWVLVGFSLLIVAGLATYFSFKTEKNKNRRERPLNSWMNNVRIYAADIVNNCVAGVDRSGPGRTLRSWWLLGIVFLTQFCSAGMKSDLVTDKSSFIDSLEDLFSKPELICVMEKINMNRPIFGVSENDPRFKGYRNEKMLFVNNIYDEEPRAIVANESGVIIEQELTTMTYFVLQFKNLKEAKRKLYLGKKKYDEQYVYTEFNKRLPRAIKEDIDYLISRLFETRQTQPRIRLDKFRAGEFVLDPTEESAATMSWSALSVAFISPVFRLWLIGMSLATFVFCVELYRSRMLRRRPVKISHHHSMGIQIRA